MQLKIYNILEILTFWLINIEIRIVLVFFKNIVYNIAV